MNINNYPPNFNNANFKGLFSHSKKKEPSVNNVPKVEKPIYKKVSPYILAGLMLVGSKTCSNMDYVPRCSGVENYDNIKVEYFDVKQDTKDSIMKPVVELKSKLNDENDFLDGVTIDVTRKFKNLDTDNSFREYVKNRPSAATKGLSFYSDSKLPRRIVIQEGVHSLDKFNNYAKTGEYTAVPALRQSLMHEVGHQFDNYFGHDHDADYAQKWDSIMYTKEKDPSANPYKFLTETKEDQEIDERYNWNCGLSDKKEFHEAILKDIKNIQNQQKSNKKELPANIKYYLQKLDLSKEITAKDIDLSDITRSEVYANLFSYVMKQDEGDRAKFVKSFSNSYEIVRKDINQYLNINVK